MKVARAGCALLSVSACFASPAFAAERELDEDTPPSTTREIETPIQRVFPEVEERRPLFPGLREQLQGLPAFFADTRLEARYRTQYLRKDRAIDVRNEAWAMGGSLYYRSGWLAELLAVSFHLPDWLADASPEVVTLTTLGYGDVVPVSHAARSLVILACVLGVLYPAILIARVVGLYVSGDTSIPFERPTRVARIWQDSSRFEALFSLQLLQILAYPYLPAAWTRGIGVLIVLAALYTLPGSRRRRAMGIAVALPALLSWAEFSPGSGWALAGAGFLATFLLLAALIVLDHVFRQREVDREVVFGVCCAYGMLGAAFASAYQLVLLVDPLAFSLSPELPAADIFPTMLYLSFVTLTTLGYGEILPLQGAAHSLASLESIVGILFPALLIARLVSLYQLREVSS
jgi:voltage-gated potassium channel Kch